MRKYQTEEERKEVKRARYKQWYQENKENKMIYRKQWYIENKKQELEYSKQYRQTPMGRALYLINNYKQKDKKANRGECTLTARWIVENIFTKPCAHCGKSGWQVIGCNRLDNSRPHTEDNVEPCCEECNNDLANIEKSKQIYQYTLDGELVKVWNSSNECGRNGYSRQNISACCNGKRKSHKGFKWSYEPIEKDL